MNNKTFYFTVDDNIRFLKEITERNYKSIFEHPYLLMYKRLHEKYALAVQLNLFYETEGFDLSKMTDKFTREWGECSDWLKLSFHSRMENVKPYKHSRYKEVDGDIYACHREILRFAGEKSLAKTTTIHYCLATKGALCALSDNGVRGLLGLYGSDDEPQTSYQCGKRMAKLLRKGEVIEKNNIYHAAIDVILNLYPIDEIIKRLYALNQRKKISIMIHEQYFYPDYSRYQPNFEEKIDSAISYLIENGYKSGFFEDDYL